MRKIISLFFAIFLTLSSVQAENVTKTINSLINKDAVSVSVKDISNNKEVYSLNKKAPMIPASTLKLVTSSAALNTLGSDYEFSTKLYKSSNNDLYLKLGADPFLTSSDLKKMMTVAKEKNILEPKTINTLLNIITLIGKIEMITLVIETRHVSIHWNNRSVINKTMTKSIS